MGNNREKSNIAIAILEKLPFLKIILHFDGSNNIFVDCSYFLLKLSQPLRSTQISIIVNENKIGAPKLQNSICGSIKLCIFIILRLKNMYFFREKGITTIRIYLFSILNISSYSGIETEMIKSSEHEKLGRYSNYKSLNFKISEVSSAYPPISFHY